LTMASVRICWRWVALSLKYCGNYVQLSFDIGCCQLCKGAISLLFDERLFQPDGTSGCAASMIVLDWIKGVLSVRGTLNSVQILPVLYHLEHPTK
jgi:hypothetical protein